MRGDIAAMPVALCTGKVGKGRAIQRRVKKRAPQAGKLFGRIIDPHLTFGLMKANPGKYSVASPGTDTTPSLSIEMLKQNFGLNFVTVPFAGGGPMIQSVLGGFTPITCAAIGSGRSQLQSKSGLKLSLTFRRSMTSVSRTKTPRR